MSASATLLTESVSPPRGLWHLALIAGSLSSNKGEASADEAHHLGGTVVRGAAPGSLLAAVPQADPAATIKTALNNHDAHAASVALNALVLARLPGKEVGRPDPVLDRLFVDAFASEGDLNPAAVILRRIVQDASAPDRGHYQLLLANYEEEIGSYDDAGATYRGVASSVAASQDDRLLATLGVARLQMNADPTSALTTLTAASSAGALPKARAWEVDLLSARAASMIGGGGSADAYIQRSWSEAPDASLDDAAVARVSSDRALTAARSGDRAKLVALMAVDRANREPNVGQSFVAADLPVCGVSGITPADSVVVEVQRLPAVGHPAMSLVWASRPGIAQPFLVAAGRSGFLRAPDGQAAAFGLRCITAPSPNFVVRNGLEESTAGWMTSVGAYPLIDPDDGESSVSEAAVLAQREARYGPNSVMLLPALFRIIGSTNIRQAADDNARKQAVELMSRIGAILEQNHAPAELTLLWHLSSIGLGIVAQTIKPADGATAIQALFVKAAADPALSLDMLYTLAMSSLDLQNAPSDFKAAMLSSTLAIFERRAPAGDQRTAALALRLYQLRSNIGDSVGAKEAIAKLGIAPDLCALSDPQPHFVSSNIQSDDYPSDLIFSRMQGNVYFDFGLNAAGTLQNGRLVLTDPPYVFDDITTARLSTVQYDPARFGNGPAPCRGNIQSVRWQLPY